MIKWLLFTSFAWAQEHVGEAAGGHEAVEIPWASITVQVFNFTFLFAILIYLLRKPVKAHFEQRAQAYRELVDRAENAKREAEQSHNVIKDRLAKLESGAQQSLVQARTEAEELKSRLMVEAKGLAEKLQVEAQRATAVELEKAKAQLRKELLNQALASSEEKLKKGLGTVDQKNLQNEFAEKIEVVSG